MAGKLFQADRQILIPFLGAGASAAWMQRTPAPDFQLPDEALVKEFGDRLQLAPQARLFLGLAVAAASQISAIEGQAAAPPPPEGYPPSAAELAELLERESEYNTFSDAQSRLNRLLRRDFSEDTADWKLLVAVLKRSAEVLGLFSPAPDLSSVAQYFEWASEREQLWRALEERFREANRPTPLHELVADAAASFLGGASAASDYLIITTNYDRLMEHALEARVPYCVLSVDRVDWKVDVRFSSKARELLGPDFDDFWNSHYGQDGIYPANFSFKHRPFRLAIVYKIHGCLYPERNAKTDSIIVSEEDYLDWMSRMTEGAIPAALTELMKNSGFLFLGYSLRDWNVRVVLRRVFEKRPNVGARSRTEIRDYAVLRNNLPQEVNHFLFRRIRVLIDDLKNFVPKIRAAADSERTMSA